MPWHNRKDLLQRIADEHGVSREYVRQWDHMFKKLDNGKITEEESFDTAQRIMDEHSDQTERWNRRK